MTLGQATAIVGFIGAVLAATFTGIMIYVTWRDRIINYRPPSKWHERSSDQPTAPGGLQ